MKSGLELRPMHHRTEARIRAHVYLCVLALLIERVAEKATGETWRTIRNVLRTQKIGQLFSPAGRLFQVSKPSAEVCKLYRLMQIEAPRQIQPVE
jgi:transposase